MSKQFKFTDIEASYYDILPEEYWEATRLAEECEECNVNDFAPTLTEKDVERLDELLELYYGNLEQARKNKSIVGNYLPEYQKEAIKRIDQATDIIWKLISEEADSIVELDYHSLAVFAEEQIERENKQYKKDLMDDFNYNFRRK